MDSKNKLTRIGEKVRALRIKKGWTSYDVFAYDCELPTKTIWRIETGKNFNMETLIKVLNGLDISLEEFFKGL